MSKEGQPLKDKMIFVSDCEGPISKNDNAFELTKYFIPDGDKIFALISKYDDVLADILKKQGYKAGDTLRLILPFLKAHGATNENIKEYSSENILMVPGSLATLQFVQSIMPSFIVSTSYEQYVSSLCDLANFPYRNAYCTKLNIDKYDISEKEKNRLTELAREISTMQLIQIPEDTKSLKDFSLRDQKTIRRLDEIFWERIPQMTSGMMLKEVSPIGGFEKANAVQDIVERLNGKLSNVIYVGDSITDVSAFQLVRRNSGLTLSFNGNKYAIFEAEIAALSDNTIVTSIISDTFNRCGKELTIQLVKEWGYPALERYVSRTLRKKIVDLYPAKLPQIELITENNRERLAKESSAFRKTVRGEAIGKLG